MNSNPYDQICSLDFDSFSKFFQGKVILNKRADTIKSAITDIWVLCFGIPSMGSYAENRGEFVNMKMDDLTAKLGATVRYGLGNSSWLISTLRRY